jgi:hypothetical protein
VQPSQQGLPGRQGPPHAPPGSTYKKHPSAHCAWHAYIDPRIARHLALSALCDSALVHTYLQARLRPAYIVVHCGHTCMHAATTHHTAMHTCLRMHHLATHTTADPARQGLLVQCITAAVASTAEHERGSLPSHLRASPAAVCWSACRKAPQHTCKQASRQALCQAQLWCSLLQ